MVRDHANRSAHSEMYYPQQLHGACRQNEHLPYLPAGARHGFDADSPAPGQVSDRPASFPSRRSIAFR